MSLQNSECKPFKPLHVQRRILSLGVEINHLKSETKKLSIECFVLHKITKSGLRNFLQLCLKYS